MTKGFARLEDVPARVELTCFPERSLMSVRRISLAHAPPNVTMERSGTSKSSCALISLSTRTASPPSL